MKQLILLFAVLLMVCSCSDEILNEDNHQAILGASNATFSFDSITEPSNWRKYQSLEEMLAACQIPEVKLKTMSTEELIEVCMSHPLHAIYIAYENELEGAKVVFNNFNGFSELRNRKDAPQKILEFYYDINFNHKTKKERRKDFSIITYMGFIELYLASKELPELYKGDNLVNLKKISDDVLDMKLGQTEKKIYTISRSLLINAQIKLQEASLSKEEANVLESFVIKGGGVDKPQDYSIISAILNK